jgi:D-alanyl-D-alanine carboxypeptidase
MRFDELEPGVERVNEHAVAVFLLVALAVFALLFLLARVTGDSPGHAEGGSDFALTGGGSAAVLVAGPEAEIVEPAAAIEAPALVETAPAPVGTALAPPPGPTSPPPPVSARAYAVVDRSCGALGFGWNEHERFAPASLTKIITGLLVAQSVNVEDNVEVHVSGSQMRARGSSIMGIEPGQVYSVLDLLYGLMLPSGNDAALALAEHAGEGDVGRFVEMMNGLASRLGMANTHFANPHGLDAREHYSTAYDLAIAGRAALDNPLLHAISSTPRWTTEGGRGISFKNGNKLLSTYPGAFGVKIGFTTAAKQTIVAAAERDGRQVIVSVLGSDDRYGDTAALLDWAFASVPSRC